MLHSSIRLFSMTADSSHRCLLLSLSYFRNIWTTNEGQLHLVSRDHLEVMSHEFGTSTPPNASKVGLTSSRSISLMFKSP